MPEDGGPFPHADLVDDSNPSGAVLAGEPLVQDAPHVPSNVEVPSTHTAAPELTHPGESQSNGLAERTVGMFEEQFCTLESALEHRLQRRVPTSHPIKA